MKRFLAASSSSSLGGLLMKRASISSDNKSQRPDDENQSVPIAPTRLPDELEDAIVEFDNNDNEIVSNVSNCASTTTLITTDANANPDKPLFFLENFLAVMEHAARHSSHLLSDDEQLAFALFSSLSTQAQGLFVRLFNRKMGAWFRVNRLVYDELGSAAELAVTATALIEHGFLNDLRIDGGRDVLARVEVINLSHEFAVLDLLSRPELVRLAQAAKLSDISKCRKAELIARLSAWSTNNSSGVTKHVNDLARVLLGQCVQVPSVHRIAFKRAEALFFVGMSLDPTEAQQVMLLAHIRGLTWPQYQCRPEHQVFPSRDAFLGYDECCQLLTRVDEALLISDNADAHIAWYALHSVAERLAVVASAARDPLCASRSLAEDLHATLAFSSEYSKDGLISRALLKPGSVPMFDQFPFLWQFSNTRIAMRLLSHCVVVVEHAKKYGDASVYYRLLLACDVPNQRRGDWFDRLCVHLEHVGKRGDSLKVAEAALSDPTLRRSDVITLRARIVRLARPPLRLLRPKLNHPEPRDAPTRTFFGVLSRQQQPQQQQAKPKEADGATTVVAAPTAWVGNDGKLCRVEEFALQQYALPENGGFQGVHCEGGVFGALFVLLMWDSLWLDVPAAFPSPNQTAPLDLSTDWFYPRRRERIDATLESLRGESSDGLRARVASMWAVASGVQCRGIDWQRYDMPTMASMAACVGGRGLAAVFGCFARVTHRRSGMPDLFLWNDERQKVRLSEVKSPNDRLSDKQVAWLETFMEAGIDCEVCLVREKREE
jgi:Fanconi-associated nuclease 1